jgi:hypothetical protein
MSDFHLSSADICLAEDNFSLFGGEIPSYQEHFNKCALEDELRNKEIAKALSEIESEEQFAFYDLGLSKNEQAIISQIKIDKFSNEVILLSKTKDDELLDIINSNLNISVNNAYNLLKLFKSIVHAITSAEDAQDAEIVLRTRAIYADQVCDYWHIDKNRNQVLEELNQASIEQKYIERVYLIPIIGEGTEYKRVELEKKEEFYKIAEETLFYYGHGPANDCREDDLITKLFSGNKEIVGKGHGSLHKVGKKGAIHKAPSQSSDGRMILIITPIKY